MRLISRKFSFLLIANLCGLRDNDRWIASCARYGQKFLGDARVSRMKVSSGWWTIR